MRATYKAPTAEDLKKIEEFNEFWVKQGFFVKTKAGISMNPNSAMSYADLQYAWKQKIEKEKLEEKERSKKFTSKK